MELWGCEQGAVVPVIHRQKLLAKLPLQPLLLSGREERLCFFRSPVKREAKSRVGGNLRGFAFLATIFGSAVLLM